MGKPWAIVSVSRANKDTLVACEYEAPKPWRDYNITLRTSTWSLEWGSPVLLDLAMGKPGAIVSISRANKDTFVNTQDMERV